MSPEVLPATMTSVPPWVDMRSTLREPSRIVHDRGGTDPTVWPDDGPSPPESVTVTEGRADEHAAEWFTGAMGKAMAMTAWPDEYEIVPQRVVAGLVIFASAFLISATVYVLGRFCGHELPIEPAFWVMWVSGCLVLTGAVAWREAQREVHQRDA